ncbi:MAG: YabP/YqfC family sporulation protein [Clostridia bacterium]|nr:YabP/YqfC family sporulation protein [Clostridia bacterium]
MKRNEIGERAERAFSLPTGSLTNGVRLEITDRKRAVIEGCKRIVTYEEDEICIATPTGRVRFRGRGLCMAARMGEQAVVTGELCCVEYE